MDWIKLPDAYPDDKQRVIFTVEDLVNHKRFIVNGVYEKKTDPETAEIINIFKTLTSAKNCNENNYKTIAWMPTPKPYGGAEFRVIVAGSRSFNDYNFLKSSLDKLFIKRKPSAIVCGEAKGADTLGRKYAEKSGIEVMSFPADWEHKGKQAGYIRNEEMAANAEACVVFWNGQSSGTKHMIETAKKLNLPLRIIKF